MLPALSLESRSDQSIHKDLLGLQHQRSLDAHSPAEHEDVVQGGVIWKRRHLLETQLFAAAVDTVRAVHPNVAVIAA